MGDEPMVEYVLTCTDLDATSAFLVGEVGLRVETVSPADDPTEMRLAGRGARVRLRRAAVAQPARLVVGTDRLAAGAPPEDQHGPDGLVVEWTTSVVDVVVPEARPTVSIVQASDRFGAGRAGMGYRDLLPDRWGGRFVASHIRIADGGGVADSVHFHRIRFQMIYVAAGWVDVVYEAQGPPFRMVAGDCVLQPPEIRHRVLRSSPGLEVIEVGCPAVHDTVFDHALELPTPVREPGRRFGDQRFVRHRATEAEWDDRALPGFRVRDTEIADATSALASVRVLAATGAGNGATVELVHDGEFMLQVVLDGTAGVRVATRETTLGRGDALAVPHDTVWSWQDWSAGFELLEVTLPAAATVPARR